MPYLRLEVSPDLRVRADSVLAAAAKVIVDTLEVKVGSLRLRLDVLAEGSYSIIDGKPQGPFVVAHIAILEGRDDAKKTRLVAEMTRVLASELNVAESDIRVFIVEYPKVHWGIGGQTAAAVGR